MRKIRVALWGTGHVGTAALKKVLCGKEYDLVGVLVYTDAKDQKDAGEIAGLEPCGIKATMDRQRIYDAKPDCIVYTAKDIGQFTADKDIVEILSHKINVVTSLPYHYLLHRHPAAMSIEDVRRAAVAGGVTLYASGVNPGTALERIALAATGGTTSMKSIALKESLRIGSEPEDVLLAFGFGRAPEDAKKNDAVRLIAEQYFGQSIFLLTDVFGTPVDQIEHAVEMRVASQKVIPPNGMVINPGEVDFVAHTWFAQPEGGPRVSTTVQWYLNDAARPCGVLSDDFHEISIEGTPSIRLSVEWRASLKSEERLYPGDPIVPIYYATAVPLVVAIASTVKALPGIRLIKPPSNSFWRRDMREPTLERIR